MRASDLTSPAPTVQDNSKPTATVQRLLETRDDQFGQAMTGKELMAWLAKQ
jgi:hypothetical protein